MTTPPLNSSLTPAGKSRPHPLLIAAALAVIVFCLVGTAAIMGWLPTSSGGNRNQLNDADRAALAAGLQQPDTAGTHPLAAAQYPAQADAPPPPPLATTPQAVVAPAYAAAPAPVQTGDARYADPAPVRTAPVASGERVVERDGDARWCGTCGNVEGIREIRTRAQGSGVGAAGGAILGGLLGNQIGSGHGRQLATVAGAVGGAVMGNQVEGNMHANISYEIRVRLDDGTLRTFHQHALPQWRSGDRVRVVKGSLRSA